jgi:hypothetical protein
MEFLINRLAVQSNTHVASHIKRPDLNAAIE